MASALLAACGTAAAVWIVQACTDHGVALSPWHEVQYAVLLLGVLAAAALTLAALQVLLAVGWRALPSRWTKRGRAWTLERWHRGWADDLLGAYWAAVLLAPGLLVVAQRVFERRRAGHTYLYSVLDQSIVLGMALALLVALPAALILVRAVQRLLRSPARRRLAGWLSGASGCALLVGFGDRVLANLHATSTLLPVLCLAVLVAQGASLTWRPRHATGTAAVLVVLAGVGIAGLAGAGHSVHDALLRRSPLIGALLTTAARQLDIDDDGYRALGLGGRDCQDRSAAQHPFAFDTPGNQLDENCSGTDAVALPLRGSLPAPLLQPAVDAMDILLLSVDTLSALHVGAYGYGRPTTPQLDALAQGCVRFARAYAAGPDTGSSLPALLTGAHSRHQVEQQLVRDLGFDATLGPLAARAGYATSVLFPFYTREGDSFGENLYLAQEVSTINQTALAEGQVRLALEVLGRPRDGRPRLLWLHFMEPHIDYIAHPRHHFGDSLVDRYDGEIAFVDEQIGTLLRGMARTGLLARTVVLVFADHGEQVGRVGVGHAGDLTEDLIRVPLILCAPGLEARVVDEPVSLVDVLPTLLEIMRVPWSLPWLQGRSLLTAARGGAAAPERHVFSELVNADHSLQAVVGSRYKLIDDLRSDHARLYDLTADPGERNNLADANPAQVDRMREILDRWRQDGSPAAAP